MSGRRKRLLRALHTEHGERQRAHCNAVAAMRHAAHGPVVNITVDTSALQREIDKLKASIDKWPQLPSPVLVFPDSATVTMLDAHGAVDGVVR